VVDPPPATYCHAILLLEPRRCRRGSSSRDWLPVQSFLPAEVTPVLLRRSHFAVGRFLGSMVFLQRGSPVTITVSGRLLSSGFASHQSLTQPDLARQPEPTGTSHGLLVPTARQGSKVHLPRASAHPLRSAFRVWLPSWRFAPFGPVPVLFHTGSAHGIHPSEVSPLRRSPTCYQPEWPTYRSTWRCSRRRSAGPAQQASVPGSWPSRESLASGRGFSPPSAGASLGFHPSRVPGRKPRPSLHPVSSHALCERGSYPPPPPAPQSINQPSFGLTHAPHLSTGVGKATLLGFLHRPDPGHSGEPPLGL
jgi:hypothetical protein